MDTCIDAGDSNCMLVLHADMAVECWHGEHVYAAVFACAVLIVLGLILPHLLLRAVRRARRQRDVSLFLRADQIDAWFDELDADQSGSLEGAEITKLHKRMGHVLDISALDPDGDGTVTKQEFTDWFQSQLNAVVDTPLDVLYGTTTSDTYWWQCFFLLWLKTVINVLYTYGSAHQINWHLAMHMVLAGSMIMMAYFDPYVAKIDQHVPNPTNIYVHVPHEQHLEIRHSYFT